MISMKKQLFKIFLLGLILILGKKVEAQVSPNKSEVQVTKAKYLGRSAPLRDLQPVAAIPFKKLKAGKKNKPRIVPNFMGREGEVEANPAALPKGADPVRQYDPAKDETGVQVSPLVSIDGMNFSDSGGVVPPDPCGDIGTDYYVQMINATYLQVFDKNGNEINDPTSVNTLWQEFGISGAGDPIILYDQEVGRWLLTEFGSPFGPNRLLVAVSETGDPLGNWIGYEFATPNFPDYPKYGIWNNSYYLTTNEFFSTPVYFIDREAMLNGEEEVDMQRITIPNGSGPGFYVPTPVDWEGDTPPPAGTQPMALRIVDDAWSGVSQDAIEMWSFNIDWDNPNNSGAEGPVTIPTASFDSYPCAATTGGFACIPQPSGGGIDGIPKVLMHRMPYRNFGTHESIVLNFITDADPGNNLSGIRWVELRRLPGENWGVHQEGTISPNDDEHRFLGAIAMDGSGNIGIAYSVSGEDTYPSLRFTGRRASDPLGEMTVEEFEFATGSSISQSDRFGDYASMSVDPVSDRTFWFTGEYMRNSSWGTRIVAFEIQRDTLDIGISALFTPQTSENLSASELVSVEVKNYGLDTVEVFQLGYQIDDDPAVIEEITLELFPDSVYVYTFAQAADMDEIKPYDLKLFSILENDQALFNDTLRVNVEKLPRFDAGIVEILGAEGVACSDTANLTLRLFNYGVDTLTSVNIFLELNGEVVEEINWTGSIIFEEWENIQVQLGGLINGQNDLNVYTSNPNGEEDQNSANDAFSRTVNAYAEGIPVFFEIRPDNDPEEVSWELTDSQGNLIYSGGDYDQGLIIYSEEWCLDPEECYTFTIFDTAGDGVGSPFGDFEITDAEGHVLAALMDVNFGFQESHDFCATFVCTLEATVSTTDASGADNNDGVIMVNVQNGGDDLEYSIDGGDNYQDNPIFSDLFPGVYQVVVQDSDNCQIFIENVVIDVTVSTGQLEPGQLINLFPNPTDGVFKVELEGLEGKERLNFTIRDALGRIVQHNHLVKYNDILTGEFSVLAHPTGVYFLVFEDPDFRKVIRVVKE